MLRAALLALFVVCVRPLFPQDPVSSEQVQFRRIERSEVPLYWFIQSFLREVDSRRQESPERLRRFLEPYALTMDDPLTGVLLREAESVAPLPPETPSASPREPIDDETHWAIRTSQLRVEAEKVGLAWGRVTSALRSSGRDPQAIIDVLRQRLDLAMMYTDDRELEMIHEMDRIFRAAAERPASESR